jgi:hypothetical protein
MPGISGHLRGQDSFLANRQTFRVFLLSIPADKPAQERIKFESNRIA